MNIIKIKFVCLICFLPIYFFNINNLAQGAQIQNSVFTLLYFINLDNCVRCDLEYTNLQLLSLSKLHNTQVIAVVHSLRKEDIFLYKQNLTVDSVVWDSGEVTEKYYINTYPSVIVLNKLNDVLYRFDNTNFITKTENLFSKLLSPLYYRNLTSITLDNTEQGVLGQARSPYINFQDSTLWTIDVLRNTVMVYSLKEGELIRSIGRSEKFNRVFNDSISNDLNNLLIKRKIPISKFDYISPLKQSKGYVSYLTLIESVKFDTILQIHNNDSTKQIHSRIYNRGVAAIHQGMDSIPEIFFPIHNDYVANYIKLRDSLYYANIKYRDPNIKHLFPEDTTYLFYLSSSPALKDGHFFLPLSKLKNYYDINKFISSSGILEYNSKVNMFVFANPWNDIFCLSTPSEQITPIQPIGSFSRTFANYTPNVSSFCNSISTKELTCYMNDILSNNKGYYILIQVNNNQKVSDFCFIQEYSWSGKFIREIPIILEDNKLSVIHLVGCTENELYLLGKTSKNGWEIKTLKLK